MLCGEEVSGYADAKRKLVVKMINNVSEKSSSMRW